MKISWLMVIKLPIRTTDIISENLWDKIKTVEASGSKADKLAKKYQLELNNGLTLEQAIENKKEYFISVTSIPFSQAREYKRFDEFENAPLYQ